MLERKKWKAIFFLRKYNNNNNNKSKKLHYKSRVRTCHSLHSGLLLKFNVTFELVLELIGKDDFYFFKLCKINF